MIWSCWLDRAQTYLRRHQFFLKTDIVRFFPNVDHRVLFDLVARTIRDERLLTLIRQILQSGKGVLADEATRRHFPGDDLFTLLRPTGLPIGNLTSQFFANVLLDPVDHFVKEELRIPGYVRDADDLVLFADGKSRLRDAHARLRERFTALRLRLQEDKTQLRPCCVVAEVPGVRPAAVGAAFAAGQHPPLQSAVALPATGIS